MNEETKDKLALLFPGDREVIRSGRLANLQLKNLELSKLDFSDTIFTEMIMRGCFFSQGSFSRSRFWNASIEDCNFEASIFSDALFGGSRIKNTNFNNSFLIRCGFTDEFEAIGTSFIRVNFAGSEFKDIESLAGSHFDDCCLDSVTGLDQDDLKKEFFQNVEDRKGWRAIDANTNKSLLGKEPEVQGDSAEIPKYEVNLDPRAGCKPGLHICRTRELANKFGKEHFKNHKVIPVDFLESWLMVVHLSGDFGRVYKYKVTR